jgi:hypothetical protein
MIAGNGGRASELSPSHHYWRSWRVLGASEKAVHLSLARRSRPGHPCSRRSSRRLARQPRLPLPRPRVDGRVGITTEFRGRSGGRPRLGGAPVQRRDRHCPVPTRLAVVPIPRSQNDHRIVASNPLDGLVRRSGRQNEHLAKQPRHRQFPKRPPGKLEPEDPTAPSIGTGTITRTDLRIEHLFE